MGNKTLKWKGKSTQKIVQNAQKDALGLSKLGQDTEDPDQNFYRICFLYLIKLLSWTPKDLKYFPK